MNTLKYFILASIAMIFLSSVACKSRQNQLTENPLTDTLPSVLQKDSLVETSKVIIVDTFKTGEPMVIHFSDTKTPGKVYEKQYYQSGKLFIEGELKNDRRTGKWIAYYENGKIWSVGYFEDGLKNGASDVYYETGKVRYNKNFEKDVAEGLWKFFDEQGNVVGEVEYENGKIISQKGVPEK